MCLYKPVNSDFSTSVIPYNYKKVGACPHIPDISQLTNVKTYKVLKIVKYAWSYSICSPLYDCQWLPNRSTRLPVGDQKIFNRYKITNVSISSGFHFLSIPFEPLHHISAAYDFVDSIIRWNNPDFCLFEVEVIGRVFYNPYCCEGATDEIKIIKPLPQINNALFVEHPKHSVWQFRKEILNYLEGAFPNVNS